MPPGEPLLTGYPWSRKVSTNSETGKGDGIPLSGPDHFADRKTTLFLGRNRLLEGNSQPRNHAVLLTFMPLSCPGES